MNPSLDAINAGHKLWRVLMQKDGSVESADYLGPVSGYDIEEAGTANIWRRSQAQAYKGKGVPDVLQATVWAEDEQHAIKIVNEKRAQMIATDQW